MPALLEETGKAQGGVTMKIYYIESGSCWHLVFAVNTAAARRNGVASYGRGNVKRVRLATEDEIRYFRNLKSEIGIA